MREQLHAFLSFWLWFHVFLLFFIFPRFVQILVPAVSFSISVFQFLGPSGAHGLRTQGALLPPIRPRASHPEPPKPQVQHTTAYIHGFRSGTTWIRRSHDRTSGLWTALTQHVQKFLMVLSSSRRQGWQHSCSQLFVCHDLDAPMALMLLPVRPARGINAPGFQASNDILALGFLRPACSASALCRLTSNAMVPAQNHIRTASASSRFEGESKASPFKCLGTSLPCCRLMNLRRFLPDSPPRSARHSNLTGIITATAFTCAAAAAAA